MKTKDTEDFLLENPVAQDNKTFTTDEDWSSEMSRPNRQACSDRRMKRKRQRYDFD